MAGLAGGLLLGARGLGADRLDGLIPRKGGLDQLPQAIGELGVELDGRAATTGRVNQLKPARERDRKARDLRLGFQLHHEL